MPAPQIMKNAFHYAQGLHPAGGTCLEFGIGFGHSYSWMVSHMVRNKRVSLIGFEGWKGLPKETYDVYCPNDWAEGELRGDKGNVLEMVRSVGGEVLPYGQFQMVDGWFEDTLTPERRASIKDVIFINIDVDLHSSTKTVLEWVKPFLKNNVVIYWDDWRDPTRHIVKNINWGENLAWFEFVRDNNILAETIAINSDNQRYMRIVEI